VNLRLLMADPYGRKRTVVVSNAEKGANYLLRGRGPGRDVYLGLLPSGPSPWKPALGPHLPIPNLGPRAAIRAGPRKLLGTHLQTCFPASAKRRGKAGPKRLKRRVSFRPGTPMFSSLQTRGGRGPIRRAGHPSLIPQVNQFQ